MEHIRVGELRSFLHSRGYSPEAFAKKVKLSHMTIRRWLARKDDQILPAKYYVTLAPHLGLAPAPPAFAEGVPSALAADAFSPESVGDMVGNLEKSGRECQDTDGVTKDVDKKLKRERFDKIFVEYCKILVNAIFAKDTPAKSKAIAIGALLYFLNPVDLIPDHIPVIGYLDDLAVLSLAVHTIAKTAETRRSARKS